MGQIFELKKTKKNIYNQNCSSKIWQAIKVVKVLLEDYSDKIRKGIESLRSKGMH